MSPEDVVIAVAARALASGTPPGDVARFLSAVLAADLDRPARDQFYAALHDAEARRPITSDDLQAMTP